jgi:energy-converting hydrogenase Eha subunit G
VVRCKVCRRLVEQLGLGKGWVGFDLLSGASWMYWKVAGWAAWFVFPPARQSTVA